MSCAIRAHEREAVLKIFQIVKRAYENLPEELKPKTRTDTKMAYDFVEGFDGTKLDSSIYVATKVRGGTVQRLHVTESAYVKDRQEMVAGDMQAVPITGSITEETTGNGFNEFYDAFIEGYGRTDYGELDYRSYFYAWHEHPEYSLPGSIDHSLLTEKEHQGIAKYGWTDGQILWRRWKMDEMKKKQVGVGLTGEQLFMQEYPSSVLEAFQSGAGAVFDQEKVGSVAPVDPMNKIDFSNLWEVVSVEQPGYYNEDFLTKAKHLMQLGWWFWELPILGHEYVAGCDPSDGVGGDNGVVSIWDAETDRQVAQFYGSLRPDELAEVGVEGCRFFNNAYLGVENNMLSTILFVSKIYDNYYFETKQDEKTLKRTKKLGWNTNSKTRDIMIDDFNVEFDEGHLTIRSKITLGEMKTFVKKENGKREHADGKNDDALFADFIARQMKKLRPKKARVFASKPF